MHNTIATPLGVDELRTLLESSRNLVDFFDRLRRLAQREGRILMIARRDKDYQNGDPFRAFMAFGHERVTASTGGPIHSLRMEQVRAFVESSRHYDPLDQLVNNLLRLVWEQKTPKDDAYAVICFQTQPTESAREGENG